MTSEVKIYSKDSVKLNILKEVIGSKIEVALKLNDNTPEDYATKIHNERSRVQVYGKFNISEDPTGDILTIRPVVIENKLEVFITFKEGISNKLLGVYRNATKKVESEFEITPDISSVEFIPQDKQKYLLRTNYGGIHTPALLSDTSQVGVRTNNTEIPQDNSYVSQETIYIDQNTHDDSKHQIEGFNIDNNTKYDISDDRFASFDLENDAVVSSISNPNIADVSIQGQPYPTTITAPLGEQRINVGAGSDGNDEEMQRLEREIAVIEREQCELLQKKKSAINYLEKIETEYKKDYVSLEQELDEIKSLMEADEEIIEHYRDQDITSVETIIQKIKLELGEVEKQIRFFIEAKQRKTMEIENEIKSNKNQ